MTECTFTKTLQCHYKRCPLDATPFSDEIESYFKNMRLSDDRNPEVYVQMTDRHGYFLHRAWIYKLFSEGAGFDALVWYYDTGIMLEAGCLELHRAYRKYRLNQRKAFIANNRDFNRICDRLGISPLARLHEASLWFSRQGRAWKEFRKEKGHL